MDLIRKMGTLLLCVVHKSSHFGQRLMRATIASSSAKIKKSLSRNTKVFFSVALIGWYSYLLCTSSEWSGDHVDIACIHVLTFLPTLRFLTSMYGKLFLATVLQLLSKYGLWRLLMYLAFLFAFSFAFVTVFLDWSALAAGRKITDFFHSRFENNVLHVNEARACAEQVVYRPHDEGGLHVHQLFRYPMEDVQMNCTVAVLGLPGGKPYKNQVEWRLNGVPLTYTTDRHMHLIDFEELPKDHPSLDAPLREVRPKELPKDAPILNKTLRELGQAMYLLRSTLTIHMVDRADFGSYTCHYKDGVVMTMKFQTHSHTERKHNKTNGRKCRPKKAAKKKASFCQCTCQPEPKRFFQDSHLIHAEYRLIMMEEKLEQIKAPPSSILFFRTAYWHLSEDEDVRMDYTVNGLSYEELCKDGAFNGCSSLQRLLSHIINDREQTWWYLHSLPLMLRERNHIFGHQFTPGHCLCENSFGRHSVTYMRTYYNKTTERTELVEITHPHTLLVRPPSQNASSFLSNFLSFAPIQSLPLADYLPEYAYDLELIKDLAVVCTMFLEITDALIIIVGMLGYFLYGFAIVFVLQTVGIVSKRLCLEGSMAYLDTATYTTRLLLERKRNRSEDEAGEKYDIYFCHSDSAKDRAVVDVCLELEKELGISCCLRDKDLQPNELELKVLSRAIRNSERFIVFLSEDLLEDGCRETEVSIILETLWEHQGKGQKVLVIRLDQCEVPVYLTDFALHDWTSSNLGLRDHHLRLVHWIAPSVNERGRFLLSGLDVWMSLLPLFLVGTSLLARFFFWV